MWHFLEIRSDMKTLGGENLFSDSEHWVALHQGLLHLIRPPSPLCFFTSESAGILAEIPTAPQTLH